ncbi:DUF3006 domain-containing protein [Virgibacillus salinus]|uniref:Uncharacterized protein n=1 Tax=Virgibacillus salinus TaxID=553311 RepID=A0A1H0YX18_9BACI|nr:DUF3006 domain-containing protein [Virgibacillus salinus]SDQ19715.1 Protein of unknown function [Virgibacillus salinus]
MNIVWKYYLLVLFLLSLTYLDSDVNSELITAGVLDRIEDGNQAVILLEELQQELVVPMHTLPPGSTPNTWLQIKMRGACDLPVFSGFCLIGITKLIK